MQSRLLEKLVKVQIPVHAGQLRGEPADDAIDAVVRTRRPVEMVQKQKAPILSAHTQHFLYDCDRIWNDVDQIWREDGVEDAVGEREVRGVHLAQLHLIDSLR